MQDGRNILRNATSDDSCIFFYAGTYRITVKDTASEYVSCANISKPKDNAHFMKKIITCSDSEFKSGHKILITSEEEKPMQIYEVEIIGMNQQ